MSTAKRCLRWLVVGSLLCTICIGVWIVIWQPLPVVRRIPFWTSIIQWANSSAQAAELELLNSPDRNATPMWTFGVIGHPRSDEEGVVNPLLEKAVEICKKKKVDILFLGGDIILGYNTSLEKYKRDLDTIVDFLQNIDIPVFVAPGNHDYSTEGQKAYFESKLNKTFLRITRDKVNFLLLDTLSWHSMKFDQRQFQFNYHNKLKRGYYFLPIPGNSDKGKPISDEQYNLFKTTISGDTDGLRPRPEDKFELPFFIGIIMQHKKWLAGRQGSWYVRWHPLLIGKNAFVFCGDHVEKPEYACIGGVHYMNTALSSKESSFVLGRFYKGKGLYLCEVNLDGKETKIDFKEKE